MKLKLSFVNKVKHADIELNGMTVIVGPNSSGKSTIGRTLFSVIKAITNTSHPDAASVKKLYAKHVRAFYNRLRFITYDFRTHNTVIPASPYSFMSQLMESDDKSAFISELSEVISNTDIVPRQRELLLRDLTNIKVCINNADNIEALLKTELRYMIESEFTNNFCSVNSEETTVELKSERDSQISFKARMNEVTDITCHDYNFISDAIYVESPLYIHMIDTLLQAKTWQEMEGSRFFSSNIVPYHIKYFAEQIRIAAIMAKNANHNRPSTNMSEIIGGELTFDSLSQQIVYKENGNIYKTINVASGIKSLSILQLFENSGMIDPNRMLIWDEPENHLHPQWQLKFAAKLVELTKNGVPILITTHSPYFLQAIRYYSTRSDIQRYVKYYSPESTEDRLVVMQDVTNDLTDVFAKLAEPMNMIMDMYANSDETR